MSSIHVQVKKKTKVTFIIREQCLTSASSIKLHVYGMFHPQPGPSSHRLTHSNTHHPLQKLQKNHFLPCFWFWFCKLTHKWKKEEIKQVLLFRLGQRFRSASSSSVCWLVKSIRVTLSSACRNFNSPEGNLVRMDLSVTGGWK